MAETAVAEEDLSLYDSPGGDVAAEMPPPSGMEGEEDLSIYDLAPPVSEAPPEEEDLSIYDIPGDGAPAAQSALAETKQVADFVEATDHSAAWNATQRAMSERAAAAGLPPAPSGNARLSDAIQRSHQAGYKFPHFTGPDAVDPTGDRTVTLDIEALVRSLQQQEDAATDPAAKHRITQERAYWEDELRTSGMSAEQWRQQTGEPDPVPRSQAFGIPNVTELRKGRIKTAQQLEAEEPQEFKNAVEAGVGFLGGLVPHSFEDVKHMIAPQTFESTQADIARSKPAFEAVMATPPYSKERFSHWLNLGGQILGALAPLEGAFRGGERVATTKGKIKEGVQAQPEGRVEGGQAQAPGVSDRIQPAAEVGPQEVIRSEDVWYHAGSPGWEKANAPTYLTRDKQWAEDWAKSRPGSVVRSFKVKGNIRQIRSGEPDELVWNQPYGSDFREQLQKKGYVGISDNLSEPTAQLAIVNPSALVELIRSDGVQGAQIASEFGMTFKGVQKTPEGYPDMLMFEDPVAGGTIAHEGNTIADFKAHLESKRQNFSGRARASQPVEGGGETVPEAAPSQGGAAPAVPGEGGAMGAAGAREKLATYEERKFGKRLASDEELVASFKEDVGNKFYEPVPNVTTFDNAVALVNERGIPQSIVIMKDMTNGLPFHLRSAMGQYMVKRLNAAIKNLGESPDAARLQNHAIETAEWLQDFGTQLGQGVQSFAAWDRLSPDGKLMSVKQEVKRLGLPELTPIQEAEIKRLAQKIEEAPEGDPRNKAVLEMNKYMANIKGFDSRDLAFGIYYGNMLSGYNTQIVNALDTFLNVNSEINGLAMTNPKAAMTIYGGLLRGFSRGKIDALHALTEGRMATDLKYLDAPRLMEVAKFGQKGGVPIKPGIIKTLAESKIAYPLNAWKYVGRLMSASDTFMYRGAEEARAALLAHRLATEEGLHGQALHNRVNEILGLDVKSTEAFREQAISEGYTGLKLKSRVAELSRLGRPKDINADATEFAGEATYNHKPHGALGFLGDTAAKVTNKVPILKTIVPFTQIVANVTNRGLNYSPYGFKRAFRGYSFEEPLKGDARAAMLMRATMGTSALGIVLGAVANELMDVHGAGPTDKEKRRQLLNTGWKPYSFQIGNRYFSYLPTPVGLEMSVMGNMIDSYRYKELGQKDAFTRAGYAFSRLGSTVFSQSFLNGTSTLFGLLSGSPGESISSFKQFAASTVGTFTTPRIVSDIQRLFDPKSYRAENIGGDLLRNTPFTSMVNKPTLNAFGEPVILPNNRFVSKGTDDPVWRFVAKTGIRISVPSRTTTVPDGEGGKRRITPEEYYGYLKQSGQELKSYIQDNMDSFEGMDATEIQDKLTEEAKAIRKRVKDEQFQ